jgi:hypothetical protein
MITVRMMQASVHEIIDMVAMGHGFMSAGRAVRVCAVRLRGAPRRIGSIHRDRMLVDMVLVHVMEMAVMQIIHMAVVADRRMPAIWAMLVGMAGMVSLGAGGHGGLPPSIYCKATPGEAKKLRVRCKVSPLTEFSMARNSRRTQQTSR